MSVVDVVDFRKMYSELAAVDGISFDVQQGEIFGLLGPNGADKTTTLECLEGLRARVQPAKTARPVGATPESFSPAGYGRGL
jgi:ABC-2 type transport system ATP-binding protein